MSNHLYTSDLCMCNIVFGSNPLHPCCAKAARPEAGMYVLYTSIRNNSEYGPTICHCGRTRPALLHHSQHCCKHPDMPSGSTAQTPSATAWPVAMRMTPYRATAEVLQGTDAAASLAASVTTAAGPKALNPGSPAAPCACDVVPEQVRCTPSCNKLLSTSPAALHQTPSAGPLPPQLLRSTQRSSRLVGLSTVSTRPPQLHAAPDVASCPALYPHPRYVPRQHPQYSVGRSEYHIPFPSGLAHGSNFTCVPYPAPTLF